jgi:WD40 repeat protein
MFQYKHLRYFIITLAIATSSHQAIAQFVSFEKKGDLPEVLAESSGLQFTHNQSLWTIIDEKKPILFKLSTTGEIQQSIHLNNLNIDWEDIARDDAGNFYIGDFGNNHQNRKNLKIYKIPSPDSIKEMIITADIIQFSYPDQTAFPPKPEKKVFDAEAFISFGDFLYIFSKNHSQPYTGYTKLYRLPNTPGTYVAELLDSIRLDPGHMYQTWITSADISPDKKMIALLTHDKVWIFSCFKQDQFFKGKVTTIQLNHFSQKEGIAFKDNNTLFISDERTQNLFGGSLYQLIIDPTKIVNCQK